MEINAVDDAPDGTRRRVGITRNRIANLELMPAYGATDEMAAGDRDNGYVMAANYNARMEQPANYPRAAEWMAMRRRDWNRQRRRRQ